MKITSNPEILAQSVNLKTALVISVFAGTFVIFADSFKDLLVHYMDRFDILTNDTFTERAQRIILFLGVKLSVILFLLYIFIREKNMFKS